MESAHKRGLMEHCVVNLVLLYGVKNWANWLSLLCRVGGNGAVKIKKKNNNFVRTF